MDHFFREWFPVSYGPDSMGTLLEVGSGKRKAGEMTSLLENGKREDAGPLVPACGLALMEVRY